MPRTLMLVFSDPIAAADEAEYNRWYSEKHLPDLVGIDGIKLGSELLIFCLM